MWREYVGDVKRTDQLVFKAIDLKVSRAEK